MWLLVTLLVVCLCAPHAPLARAAAGGPCRRDLSPSGSTLSTCGATGQLPCATLSAALASMNPALNCTSWSFMFAPGQYNRSTAAVHLLIGSRRPDPPVAGTHFLPWSPALQSVSFAAAPAGNGDGGCAGPSLTAALPSNADAAGSTVLTVELDVDQASAADPFSLDFAGLQFAGPPPTSAFTARFLAVRADRWPGQLHLTVDRCAFHGSKWVPVAGQSAGVPAGEGGGSLGVSAGPLHSVTVSNCNFTDGRTVVPRASAHLYGCGASGFDGGAVAVRGARSLTMTRVRVVNVWAEQVCGGGLFISRCATVALDQVHLEGNRAAAGGAVYAEHVSDSLTVTGLSASLNEALAQETTGGNGGALHLFNTSRALTLSNVQLNENSAATRGGALYVTQHCGGQLSFGRAESNSAPHGSTMYLGSQKPAGLCGGGPDLFMDVRGTVNIIDGRSPESVVCDAPALFLPGLPSQTVCTEACVYDGRCACGAGLCDAGAPVPEPNGPSFWDQPHWGPLLALAAVLSLGLCLFVTAFWWRKKRHRLTPVSVLGQADAAAITESLLPPGPSTGAAVDPRSTTDRAPDEVATVDAALSSGSIDDLLTPGAPGAHRRGKDGNRPVAGKVNRRGYLLLDHQTGGKYGFF